MKQEQFDALVERLEVFARQHAASYKLHVGLLAALGYIYIFIILLGLFVIFAWSVWLFIAIAKFNFWMFVLCISQSIPILIVLNSLWVKVAPPTGLELIRSEFPQLFVLIDELTNILEAPQFHYVLLTEEFNAAIVQVPRWGIFGLPQNYLVLGLPLMQALSPVQFRAVLAHELGHLSGNHGRFSGWIYRVRKTWVQLLERLKQGEQRRVFALFEIFFNWYVPFFQAYSFVLGRNDEYEADRRAAQLAGVDNMAEALIAISVKSRFLDNTFWPSIHQQVEHEIEPPSAAFTTMFAALGNQVTTGDANKWLEQSLARKTDNVDTHPCLSDRLTALGYLINNDPTKLVLPPSPKVSAAKELLASKLEPLIEHFNQEWKEKIATPWRQRFAHAQEIQKNLQNLVQKAQTQTLTIEEAWNRACWTAEIKGDEKAIALFYEVLVIQPNHAGANYTVGQFLLQQQDATGIKYMNKAMQAESDWVIDGCGLVYNFLKQQGQLEAAKGYQKQAEQHYKLILMARQERSNLWKGKFAACNLPDTDLEKLLHQLSQYPEIKKAYLVQQVLQYFPEKPIYVLGIVSNANYWLLDIKDKNKKLRDRLVQELARNIYIVILDNNTTAIKQKICKIKGAAIYTRKKFR